MHEFLFITSSKASINTQSEALLKLSKTPMARITVHAISFVFRAFPAKNKLKWIFYENGVLS